MMETLIAEEWRPIAWAPSYEVSSLGRVRSYRRSTLPRVLGGTVRQGYPRVTLRNVSGERVHVCAHVLVAEAFLGPRPAGMEVRHLDGDRANPRLTNLAYGTKSQNARDMLEHGTHNMAGRASCANGHEFTPENTRPRAGGGRVCVECKREAKRRQWARHGERYNAERRKSVAS